jgi:hypothetical protein
VLEAVRIGNLDQAGKWQAEARDKVLAQLKYITDSLAGVVTVDEYVAPWLKTVDGAYGEARHINRPIDLKGDLSDPLWSEAQALKFGKDGVPDNSTELRLLYTDDALYVGFVCHESMMDKLQMDRRGRDSDTWNNDSVEVFLNSNGLGRPYYQFCCTPAGTVLDGLNPTPGATWNGDWEVKTALGIDRWSAEFRIPFKTIGVDAAPEGNLWFCNFCRSDFALIMGDFYGAEPSERSSYGGNSDGFHDFKGFKPIWFK